MMKSLFPKIVIATRNMGKLREFQTLLQSLKSDLLSLQDISITEEIEEEGSTFAENAQQKAIGYSRMTTFPVLADDSGLMVEVLEGRPGIHSARYAGQEASDADRIGKLLTELASFTGNWNARFHCSLALAQHGALLQQSEGSCSGVIISEPRGSHGFGYDPVFLIPDLRKTFAELNESEKNIYSHRARAVQSLLKKLC
jgi:XTP/dITP diphosphohydrolase